MAKQKRSTKAVVLLCEGKTDVAFIRRVLLSDDYRDYKEVVNNMPKALSNYFANKIKEYSYDSSNLRDRPLLPIILRRTHGQSDTFALLYDMNGMNRTDNYEDIIDDFKRLGTGGKKGDFLSANNPIKAALGFIYDLDDKSRDDRLNFIKDNFQGVLDELKYLSNEEGKQITNSKELLGVGYYLISTVDTDKKDLEDIIIPLMEKSNPTVFEITREFIEKNKTSVEREEENYNMKKSTIGVVGQLEFSGLQNADIIKNTKLLNGDIIKKDPTCDGIIKFVKNLRKSLEK